MCGRELTAVRCNMRIWAAKRMGAFAPHGDAHPQLRQLRSLIKSHIGDDDRRDAEVAQLLHKAYYDAQLPVAQHPLRADISSTALHYAAWLGAARICEMLVFHYGADPARVNNQGKTPAQFAAESGHKALASMLQSLARGDHARATEQLRVLKL